MTKNTLSIGREYRHYKGGAYHLITIGKLESDGENGEDYCVYQSKDDLKIWIRPLNEFSQKFTIAAIK